jgi:cobalamin biosynthesis protein CbiG
MNRNHQDVNAKIIYSHLIEGVSDGWADFDGAVDGCEDGCVLRVSCRALRNKKIFS